MFKEYTLIMFKFAYHHLSNTRVTLIRRSRPRWLAYHVCHHGIEHRPTFEFQNESCFDTDFLALKGAFFLRPLLSDIRGLPGGEDVRSL